MLNGLVMKVSHLSYSERSKGINIGEQLFEDFCNQNQYIYYRLGFDAHNTFKPVYKLNILLRNIPDYVVETPKGVFVVAVKGTGNIKEDEINLIPLMLEWYSSKESPLVYCFCFDDKPIKLLYPEQVIKLYEEAKYDKKFTSDNKIYRSLKIYDV
jgi:hypothetical protein